MNEVTRLLSAMEQGDPVASEQLLPLVYDELRRLAKQRMAKEPAGQTLQATALVHDAFVRLVDVQQQQQWNSRGHFFAAAAEAMRRILVEKARRRQRIKHGGALAKQELNEAEIAAPDSTLDLVALDEALTALAAEDPIKARLIELRFFAGLTFDEAAEVLGVSAVTAKRYWRYARAWLCRRMGES